MLVVKNLSSNSITVTRTDVCEPAGGNCSAPEDIQVEVLGPRKIRVDWEDVSNASKYLIEIRFVGKTRIAGRGRISRSRVHIFAPSGRDYEFQIKTICEDGGESVFTDWIPFSTPSNLGTQIADSRNRDLFDADIEIGTDLGIFLKVFPNPVEDIINISYQLKTGTATLEIYHVSGKLVLKTILANPSEMHQLNINNLTDGLYYLTISEKGQKSVTQKIIKGSME